MKSWGKQIPYISLLSQVHKAKYGWACPWFTCLLQCESIEHWYLVCDQLNFSVLWGLLSISSFTSSIFNVGDNQMQGVTYSCSLYHIWFNIKLVQNFIKLRFYNWYLNKFLCEYWNGGIHLIWRMDMDFWSPMWEPMSRLDTIFKAPVCNLINKVIFTGVSYARYLTS
jgi:hypothetical protein